MLQMVINEKACRGCEMCVDVCPTDCFVIEKETNKVLVDKLENCIACLSCAYICPSGAIVHSDYHVVGNYYRNLLFSKRMEKFL